MGPEPGPLRFCPCPAGQDARAILFQMFDVPKLPFFFFLRGVFLSFLLFGPSPGSGYTFVPGGD